MNKKQNDYYDKKIDNELKKKELEKKYGAKFQGNSNLPPEIENEWLKNIEEFENQFQTKKRTIVWKYIGKPSFKKIEELKAADIPGEFERITGIMEKNNIALSTLCEVDTEELYRFITEELFNEEIDDIHVGGMTTHFTYEEFHPNAEYDIKHAYDYFFKMTMSKMKNIGGEGYDLLYIDTDNFVDTNGEKLDEKKVINTINNFLDSFDYFEYITNEINKIYLNDDKTDAQLTFTLCYKGRFKNRAEEVTYNGKGFFRLKPSDYGGWDIYHLNIPGLEF